ncbi:tetratricopeptide repeat-containing sulfotransferase family protein [Magnetospira sp. QH-2]|uniref:tetratricopeptide repeat-containing sulfotransferase family protein n=1 Tax=Magnetospira sp. (strain QH-2) TaxID=1288970 RepID=UPI0003E80E44|nr:tetratricopeptide repeat-containing sulfotransferase family protein [Magnetospira sp. QH-2]CCQ75601.1 putative Sulfotransferase with TPR repeats [Magnetospira sp. QH-2]
MAKSRRPREQTHPPNPDLQGGLDALRRGDLQRAIPALKNAARRHPGHAESQLYLGVALSMAGRSEDAARALDDACRLAPGNGDAQYNYGLVLLGLGRPLEAVPRFEKVLAKKPKDAETHMNLGLALKHAGSPKKALRHLRRSVQLAPKSADAWINLGNLLIQMEDPEDAATAFRSAQKIAPRNAAPWTGSAMAHMALAQTAQGNLAASQHLVTAEADLETALKEAPDSIEALSYMGLVLERLDRLAEAEHCLRRAYELSRHRGSSAEERQNTLQNFALFLDRVNQTEGAVDFLENELEQGGYQPTLVRLLARMLTSLNRYDNLESLFAAYESQGFSRSIALLYRCVDRQYHLSESDVANLKAVLDLEQENADDLAGVAMALFHHFDLNGDQAKAFEYLTRSNAWARQNGQPYLREAEDGFADMMAALFATGIPSGLKDCGHESEQPVFIVGMPRSGTTLVEQVIASHPACGAAGELSEISAIAKAIAGSRTINDDFSPGFRALDCQSIREFANRYLNKLTVGGEPHHRRIIDKMPSNFKYLGLIASLFPKARIIHCRRHPMATCYSILTQRFNRAHPYAYAQEDLAHQYRHYERLMAFWESVLPIPIHTVRYEDLVTDPDAEIRSLIKACGLSWDDRCLQFHQTERVVKTASQWQVRQPMYQTSLDHWQHYGSELSPLKQGLGLPD